MSTTPLLDSFERTLALSQMLIQLRQRNEAQGKARVTDVLGVTPRETAKGVAQTMRGQLEAEVGPKPKPGLFRQTRYKNKRAMTGLNTLDTLLASGALDLSPEELAQLEEAKLTRVEAGKRREANAFNDRTSFAAAWGRADEDPTTMPTTRVFQDTNEVFDLYTDTASRFKEMIKRGYVPVDAANEQQINSMLGDSWQRLQGNTQQPNTSTSSSTPVPGSVTEAADAIVSRWPDPTVRDAIMQASTTHGTPYEILVAVADQESGGGTNRGPSSAGAVGMFQFMPGTAKQYGVDVNDDASSAMGASKYLKYLYDNTPQTLPEVERWRRALTSYNGGEGSTKFGAQANSNPENQSYANGVLARIGYQTDGDMQPSAVAGVGFTDEVTAVGDTRPLSQVGAELRSDASARGFAAPVVERSDKLFNELESLKNQRAAAIQYLAALGVDPEGAQPSRGVPGFAAEPSAAGALPAPKVQQDMLAHLRDLDTRIAQAEQDVSGFSNANTEALRVGGGRTLAGKPLAAKPVSINEQNDAFVRQQQWSPDLAAIPEGERAKLEQLAADDPMVLLDAMDTAMQPQFTELGIDPRKPPARDKQTPAQRKLLEGYGKARTDAEAQVIATATTPEQQLKILARYGVTASMTGQQVYQHVKNQMLSGQFPLSAGILQLAMTYGLKKDLPTPSQPPASFRSRREDPR